MMGMLACAAVSTALAAAPAGSNAAAAAEDSRQVRYVVRSGDSMAGFVRRYLISRAAIGPLLVVNRIPAPRWLVTGETLTVPYKLLRWVPVDGRVKSFRGRIAVGARTAAVGQPVTAGTLVTTVADSFVAIAFPDGSIATLPSNSAMRIVSLRRYLLTGEVDRRFAVQRGASEWQVTPARTPGDRFEVRTPVALAAVRGTRFRVTFDDATSRSGSGVVKGEVELATDATPIPVSLPVGFGAVTDRVGTIDRRALLAAPQLREPYAAQRRASVTFATTAIAGAATYLFDVARDAGFLAPVASLIANRPEVTVPGLADGNYFVRVSAIDDVGLQGFSTVYAFTRRLNVLASRAEPNRMSRLTWRSGGPGTRAYRLVISYTRDLDDPIVDVGGLTTEGAVVGPLPPGRYFWAVTTIAREGADTSETESFEVGTR